MAPGREDGGSTRSAREAPSTFDGTNFKSLRSRALPRELLSQATKDFDLTGTNDWLGLSCYGVKKERKAFDVGCVGFDRSVSRTH